MGWGLTVSCRCTCEPTRALPPLLCAAGIAEKPPVGAGNKRRARTQAMRESRGLATQKGSANGHHARPVNTAPQSNAQRLTLD